MAWTWYQANTQYESDRWRIFFREDGGISDYNPNNTPDSKTPPVADLTRLNDKVVVATDLLNDTRKFESEFSPLAANHYAFSVWEKPISRVYRQGNEFLAKTPTSKAAAFAVAQQHVATTLPVDAALEYVIPITASVDGGPKQKVAYAVRYGRQLDGLAIRSNHWKNHLEIVVNDGQVAFTSNLWPQIQVEPTSTPDVIDQILSVDLAVFAAADHIARLVKTPVTIVRMEPCYGNTENEVVPAYTLFTDQEREIIVDARTGEVIL
jgi:hypothetical protein